MRAIVSLTVPEGKRLIARAISQMPEIRHAREMGKILLKGGTTVSALAEELVGVPMRISGRVTPRGLKSSDVAGSAPHSMLVVGAEWRNIDDEMLKVVESLGAGDVVVIGANAIDAYGGAAMFAGAPLGGNPGLVMTGMMVEGPMVIVAAGLEKLIPGRLCDAVQVAGRKRIDISMGMSVGLMPIFGRVVTEVDAFKLLAPVDCQVIGRGGIAGAEGSTAFVLSGEESDVKRLFRLALELKGATTSGAPDSLVECVEASSRCRGHRACIYRSPKLLE
ncbi:MAG TPA: hypothetical protein VHS28_01615 [Chloroflexota bacterium]|nr:hypothetical protein [Chloroflexota bacterium]